MSLYGKKWVIDGVVAGPIMRSDPSNGMYTIAFEREYASLEQIEGINWAAPEVEYIGKVPGEKGLPEGYGFTLDNILYSSGTKTYKAVVRTASQYLGDVTGYQDQVETLEATVEKQAAAIRVLEESGSAAELESELDAAYQEGVNSVE